MMKEGEGGGTREETRRISLSLFHDNLPFVRVSLNEKSVESARIRLKHARKGFPRELHAEHPHEKCTRWPRRPFRKKKSPFPLTFSFFLSFFRYLIFLYYYFLSLVHLISSPFILLFFFYLFFLTTFFFFKIRILIEHE